MKSDSAWRPSAGRQALHLRAGMLATARNYFSEQQVLEVETPVLCRHGVTDPNIHNISAGNVDSEFWLRSSPEYHMKRLLAAKSGDIYQIGKAFRGGEQGKRHQPEFTLIEWYRCGFSLQQLATETCKLISLLSDCTDKPISGFKQTSYAKAFQETVSINPLDATTQELIAVATRLLPAEVDQRLRGNLGEDRSNWLDLLASHLVYPALEQNTLWVIDQYPAEQAQLARINELDKRTAERFEVFFNGIELANGFYELADAQEQTERFAADNQHRLANKQQDMVPDTLLLDALDHGLPECAGVALGLDRVLLVTGEYTSIGETMSFIPGN